MLLLLLEMALTMLQHYMRFDSFFDYYYSYVFVFEVTFSLLPNVVAYNGLLYWNL